MNKANPLNSMNHQEELMGDLDSEISLMFRPENGEFIRREDCRVILSEDYNRKQIVPSNLETEIEKIWQKRLKENGKLFNGTKFRVASVYKDSDRTTLCLGITCYKDFIGTNWSPEAEQLQKLGRENYKNSQTYMSDALGVGALVLTSDDHVILLRRSEHCGEAAGLWDVPGGHAEPEEIVGKVETNEIKLEEMRPESVRDEVYNSILREVRDEVNIPEDTLSDPLLIGVARNTTSAGRPSLEFFIRCSLSASDVLSRYQTGTHSEAEESTNIKLLRVEELWTLQSGTLWDNIAPSAKGCFTLYNLTHNQTLQR